MRASKQKDSHVKLNKSSFMKKALHFLVFIGIILLLLGIGSYFVNPLKVDMNSFGFESKQYYTSLLREDENIVDVLVLGDSEGFGLLSTMHLWQDCGTASYIAAQPLLQVSEEYYSLKTILKKQSPKLVIIETNNIFDLGGQFTEIKIAVSATFCHYFPIVGYHSAWKKAAGDNLLTGIHYNGFSIRASVVPYENTDFPSYTDSTAKMNFLVKFYLDKIVKLCRKNNIEVLLVSAPVPTHFSYEKHNAIKEYADKNNINFLDMNLIYDELGLDFSTDTLDGGDHVNLYGTLKMTTYLEKYLADNYTLPDRRGDQKYSIYDERAAAFMGDLARYQ